MVDLSNYLTLTLTLNPHPDQRRTRTPGQGGRRSCPRQSVISNLDKKTFWAREEYSAPLKIRICVFSLKSTSHHLNHRFSIKAATSTASFFHIILPHSYTLHEAFIRPNIKSMFGVSNPSKILCVYPRVRSKYMSTAG